MILSTQGMCRLFLCSWNHHSSVRFYQDIIIFQPFNVNVNYKQSSRNLNLRQVKQCDFEKKYRHSHSIWLREANRSSGLYFLLQYFLWLFLKEGLSTPTVCNRCCTAYGNSFTAVTESREVYWSCQGNLCKMGRNFGLRLLSRLIKAI